MGNLLKIQAVSVASYVIAMMKYHKYISKHNIQITNISHDGLQEENDA